MDSRLDSVRGWKETMTMDAVPAASGTEARIRIADAAIKADDLQRLSAAAPALFSGGRRCRYIDSPAHRF